MPYDFDLVHPDPVIAREVVLEDLAGRLAEARAGLTRALDLPTPTLRGVAIKRDIIRTLAATAPPSFVQSAQQVDYDLAIGEYESRLVQVRATLDRALDYKAGTPDGLAIKHDVRSALFRTAAPRVFE